MKDIIYLDVDLMNSMLAQLENGLKTSYSTEDSQSREESATSRSGEEISSGLDAKVSISTGIFPGGSAQIGGKLGGKGSEQNSETESLTEGQKDILNKQFHDAALDNLLKLLEEENKLTKAQNASEGSLLLSSESFRFYDFNLISNSVNPELFKQVALGEIFMHDISYEEAKKLVKKQKPTSTEREKMNIANKVVAKHEEMHNVVKLFEQLKVINTYSNNLLPNLVIIKTSDKKIGLLKESNLRQSTASLAFRTDTTRKAKFLVRVIGKKREVYDGIKDFPNLDETDLDRLPTFILDILLGSFKIIEKNDLVVSPIAIFYE
ncbi:DUF6414 family protein [Shouchella lehensis]|uniref:Uncharacterized protein n=1 Tax=Shouchella lehensis TaxID=300825 RepID=A0A4Y7WJ24_9BACI|nr:hypothetical protein [Shouchella lehensis]MBG9785638.1 hypothetical protein [Shouchella lehensis]TES48095.1 hypothetical protein E2L03_13250 [Shouchella lehensis]